MASVKHVPPEALREGKLFSHKRDSLSLFMTIPEQTRAFLKIFGRHFKSKEEKFLENSVTLNQKIHEVGIELRKALTPHENCLGIKY